MPRPPTLRTERLHLRPVTARDVEPLVCILAEPEVARWWRKYDAERVRREILNAEPACRLWTIEHIDTVIGAIELYERADPDYRHAGLDLFISVAQQGNGFAREAIEAVCQHAFTTLDHHRLIIDPAAANEPAIRAYAAVGFERVGVMRQYERGPDGRWYDSLLMERLRGR